MSLQICLMSHNVGTLFVRNTKEESVATAPYFDGTQLCMQMDSNVFFPEAKDARTSPDKMKYKDEVTMAKNVCNTCHFVIDCLKYALDNDVVGIWGATDTKEREQIRKQMNIPKPKSIHSIVREFSK